MLFLKDLLLFDDLWST